VFFQKHFYFWIIALAFNAGLSFYWSVNMYKDWQQNPTMTTLVTSASDIKDLNFPAVTICPRGIFHGVYVRCSSKDPK